MIDNDIKIKYSSMAHIASNVSVGWLLLSITLGHAFAQEPSTFMVDRRVEIWALFYRGMVGAFRCGSIGARKYCICRLEV